MLLQSSEIRWFFLNILGDFLQTYLMCRKKYLVYCCSIDVVILVYSKIRSLSLFWIRIAKNVVYSQLQLSQYKQDFKYLKTSLKSNNDDIVAK